MRRQTLWTGWAHTLLIGVVLWEYIRFNSVKNLVSHKGVILELKTAVSFNGFSMCLWCKKNELIIRVRKYTVMGLQHRWCVAETSIRHQRPRYLSWPKDLRPWTSLLCSYSQGKPLFRIYYSSNQRVVRSVIQYAAVVWSSYAGMWSSRLAVIQSKVIHYALRFLPWRKISSP